MQANFSASICNIETKGGWLSNGGLFKQSIEAMLQRADLLQHFDFFLSNQDVSKPKPDPEIYLKAMERLNVRPEDCLVVEDNHNGIKAAQAAGAHLLCVADVSEVNFSNISARIRELETSNA
jgi:beta-phosphoglucomutase-like phosphatase (HAD superfamily)